MMDKALWGMFDCRGTGEGPGNQALRHAGTEGIADDIPVKKILMSGAVEPALIGWDVGNIAHPDLVRRESLELLLQEVLRHGKWMRPIRRCLELLDLFASYSVLFPETPDAMNNGHQRYRRMRNDV
jgi:hypothetical protein